MHRRAPLGYLESGMQAPVQPTSRGHSHGFIQARLWLSNELEAGFFDSHERRQEAC
jgi:hypothetical protein